MKRTSRISHSPDLVTATRKTGTGNVLSVLNHSRRYQKAVVAELKRMLVRAEEGELIGIVYVLITSDHSINGGLSGLLAKDRMKAAGMFFGAAMRAADDFEE